MSWVFVADDGEQVHYDVPPQVAELEAKLEHERYLRDRDNTELIQYQKKLEAKLKRYEHALTTITEYNAMEHDICHGQRMARAALEGEQDGD